MNIVFIILGIMLIVSNEECGVSTGLILLIIGIIWTYKKKRSKNENSNNDHDGKTKMTKKGLLLNKEFDRYNLMRGNYSKPFLCFENGKVWWDFNNSFMGSYDDNGQVFDKEHRLIGKVRLDDGISYLYACKDASFEKWLKTINGCESQYQKPKYNDVRVGEIWASSIFETDSKGSCSGDIYVAAVEGGHLGGGAAYLLALEDGLINSIHSDSFKMTYEEFAKCKI